MVIYELTYFLYLFKTNQQEYLEEKQESKLPQISISSKIIVVSNWNIKNCSKKVICEPITLASDPLCYLL